MRSARACLASAAQKARLDSAASVCSRTRGGTAVPRPDRWDLHYGLPLRRRGVADVVHHQRTGEARHGAEDAQGRACHPGTPKAPGHAPADTLTTSNATAVNLLPPAHRRFVPARHSVMHQRCQRQRSPQSPRHALTGERLNVTSRVAHQKEALLP